MQQECHSVNFKASTRSAFKVNDSKKKNKKKMSASADIAEMYSD